MRAVRFHPEADEELTETRERYVARSEVAAQAFAVTHGERRFVYRLCDMILLLIRAGGQVLATSPIAMPRADF